MISLYDFFLYFPIPQNMAPVGNDTLKLWTCGKHIDSYIAAKNFSGIMAGYQFLILKLTSWF